MTIKIVHLSDVKTTDLPGRKMRLAISEAVLGAKKSSGGVIWIQPGCAVTPCHAHSESEEILFIIKGKGKVWVDGETSSVKSEDFILFPKNSRHMLKNTGNMVMKVLFIFSPPTNPSKYILFPEINFPEVTTS
jgi:putative monooxygenase